MTTPTAAEELKTLAKLKVSPKFAWPTIALMVLSHAANISSWIMVIGGYVSDFLLWA